MTERRLCYRRHTWPGKSHDFNLRNGELQIGFKSKAVPATATGVVDVCHGRKPAR